MGEGRQRLLVATIGLLVACDTTTAITDTPSLATAVHGLSACPDGEMIDGVDVSKYQKGINWSLVAEAGIDFAFIRVSNGAYDLDPYFDFNWTQAKVHGVVRGVYQFFRVDQDPVAQAELLLAEMGPLEPGDLPLLRKVGDVLQSPGLTNFALDKISVAAASWPRQHEGEQEEAKPEEQVAGRAQAPP